MKNQTSNLPGNVRRAATFWTNVVMLICLFDSRALLKAALTPTPGDQSAPAMASSGDVTLVVWQDRRGGTGYDIYGARVSPTGEVLGSVCISTAPGDQKQPAVACNSNEFLIVWADFRNGYRGDIYGARVNVDGTVLDPQGIPICTNTGSHREPVVASDGTDFLVVWQDVGGVSAADIMGARVSHAGTILDANGIAISQAANHQLNPTVAGNAAGYLAIWQDFRDGTSYNIRGTRITRAGTVSNPASIAISTAASDQLNPTVSGNGTNFMVLWQDFRSDARFDIYGTLVTGDGMVQNTNGTVVSASGQDAFNPVLVSEGTGWLAVWTDFRSGTNYAIYGTRISAAGAVVDTGGLVLARAVTDQYSPTVAGHGSGYSLAWQDHCDATSADIFGIPVTTGGVVSGATTLLSGLLASTTPFLGQWQTINLSHSTATLRFAGITGYSYEVRRSTNLATWVVLSTNIATGTGRIDIVDNFADLPGLPTQAFYRLRLLP